MSSKTISTIALKIIDHHSIETYSADCGIFLEREQKSIRKDYWLYLFDRYEMKSAEFCKEYSIQGGGGNLDILILNFDSKTTCFIRWMTVICRRWMQQEQQRRTVKFNKYFLCVCNVYGLCSSFTIVGVL